MHAALRQHLEGNAESLNLPIDTRSLSTRFFSPYAQAQTRTYQGNKYGAKEHSKCHYETDTSERTHQVDQYGAKQYSKGSFQADKNGVTTKVDEYGQKLRSEGTFITEKPKPRSKRSDASQ